MKAYLDRILPKVLEIVPSYEVLKYDIRGDHIHMVMIISPKYALNEVVGRIKGLQLVS